MGLDFGAHPDVVFKHAPLTTVLCQIRFPPVLSLLAQAGITGFQAAVREQYPALLPVERIASLEVSVEAAKLQTTPPVWRFTDEDRVWTIGLAVDFVSLETSRYEDIDDFLRRLARVLKALNRTIRPADSTRVGLRKVNAIKVPEGERNTAAYVGKIRKELLGPMAVGHFPAPISGCASQLEFAEDYNRLIVRYGLHVADDRLSFLLDMDYFTEQPYKVDESGQMEALLRHFNEGMTSFFHWALDDDFKKTLEPVARSEGVAS